MEFLRKKINLRDFTKKIGEKCDCSGATFPCDLDITDISGLPSLIVTGIPYYVTSEGSSGVKYGTLERYYSWIRQFIMKSRYYTFKNDRNGGIMWQELGEYFEFRGNGVDEVGKIDLFASAVGVFEELSSDIIEGYTCNENDPPIFCINAKAEEFYNLYFSIEEAVEYIDYFEETILTNSYSNISLPPFADFNVLLDSDIDDMGSLVKYTYQEPHYVNDDVIQWQLSFSACTDEPYIVEISGYTESKLRTLARQKSCVDDDGNELDFIFDLYNLKCELKYATGMTCNGVYDDSMGVYTYDKVIDISLSDGTINYNNLTNNDIGKKGAIYFKYSIGNMIFDIDGNYVTNGVIYEETHDFEIQQKTFTVGGHLYTRPYIYIDYYSGDRPVNAEEDKFYAKVSYEYEYDGDACEEIESGGTKVWVKSVFIRDDSLTGVDDLSFSNGNIVIDRGHAAAYEAFNVLGEVNSLDDIEKYHDDWFRIRGKND